MPKHKTHHPQINVDSMWIGFQAIINTYDTYTCLSFIEWLMTVYTMCTNCLCANIKIIFKNSNNNHSMLFVHCTMCLFSLLHKHEVYGPFRLKNIQFVFICTFTFQVPFFITHWLVSIGTSIFLVFSCFGFLLLLPSQWFHTIKRVVVSPKRSKTN